MPVWFVRRSMLNLLVMTAIIVASEMAEISSASADFNVNTSKCNVSSIPSLCFLKDEWISYDQWTRQCSCLLNQNITKKDAFGPPVLHCRDDISISVTWSNNTNSFDPVDGNYVFLLEMQNEEDTWRSCNVTRRFVSVVHNLKPSSNYRFRVRNISMGFQEVSQEGNWTSTLPPVDGEEPTGKIEPVKRVWVVPPLTFYKNLTANARIQWEPGEDRTCWYHLVTWRYGHEDQPDVVNMYMAESPMKDEIILKMREKYVVGVNSLERNFSHSAAMVSCSIFPVNLNISGPTAPDIHVNHSVIEENHTNTRINLTIAWSSFPGGQPSNVTIFVFSDVLNLNDTVPGNISIKTFSDVSFRRYCFVDVFASSPGGVGLHKNVSCMYKEAHLAPSVRPNQTKNHSSFIKYFVIASITIFLTIIFLYVGYIRLRKFWRQKETPSSNEITSINSSDVNAVVCYDEWDIPREKLSLGKEIGRGAFGTVHHAFLNQPTGRLEVAVKKLRPDPTSDDARQFMLEMEIMKGVGKHPNVLALLGCVTKQETGFLFEQLLVVEYCALGDLQGFLRKAWKEMAVQASNATYVSVDTKCVNYAELMSCEDSSSESTYRESDDESLNNSVPESQPLALSNQTYGLYLGMEGQRQNQHRNQNRQCRSKFSVTPEELLSFARQVAIGMEFLATSRVIHRDLAARNVLMCANRTVKISDFGLSRDVYEQNFYKKGGAEKIPVKWMAIESLMHQVYTSQSDVWSFGILLWEIVTLGGSPYPSVTNDAIFQLLSSGYRMERPPTCGTELYKLMRDCWQTDPKDRPTFTVLKNQLDTLLEATARNQYIQIDQLFAATWEGSNVL